MASEKIIIDVWTLARIGKISVEDLQRHMGLAAEMHQDPVAYLARNGHIDTEDIFEAFAREQGMEYRTKASIRPNSAIINMVPHELARELRVIPVRITDDQRLVLAVSNPTRDLKNALESALDYEFEYAIASHQTIDDKVAEYYSAVREASSIAIDAGREDAGPSLDAQLAAGGGDQSVAKNVKLLMMEGVESGASDIHIEPIRKEVRVRYRIDGELQVSNLVYSPQVAELIVARIKVMAGLDTSERRLPQDGRITFPHNGKKVDLRVAVVPVVSGAKGEKVVMRILANDLAGKPLEQLDFSPLNLRLMADALSRPNGMVLVTGPTGSGKSTTLYAGIGQVAKDDVNVMTAEDPVEYKFDGANQVNVNPEIGFTFAEALRSFLRADPDVILIGEIRDRETAEIAIKAALTGHLVLSTLHTNSAALTVSRLIDMDVAPYLVADALTAVLAQRLVRRLCRHCKVVDTRVDLAKARDLSGENLAEVPTIYRANIENPCSRMGCRNGYAGRVPIHELLPVSGRIKKAITQRRPADEIEAMAISGGKMKTLLQDGWAKVVSGITDVDQIEALRMDDGNEEGEPLHAVASRVA